MFTTQLHDFHRKLGARMVSFAGYEMPLSYAGIIREHEQTRSSCSLFDVSHMRQMSLSGPGRTALAERLTPAAIGKLAKGRSKYTVMCNASGGVIDDMIIGNDGDELHVVCNAARGQAVAAHIRANLGGDTELRTLDDFALLALQGPKAEAVLARIVPQTAAMCFMDTLLAEIGSSLWRVSRSGYTGEDGFEISVPGSLVEEICTMLLGHDEVRPAGLGARNTLRLEAGLCLWGNEMDETVSPVEAGLQWAIPPSRIKEGGFVGAHRILRELAGGGARTLVGLLVEGRLPLRDGSTLNGGGVVTSGAWSPTLGRPIALALLNSSRLAGDAALSADLRGKKVGCTRADLPFVPHRYRLRSRMKKTQGEPK